MRFVVYGIFFNPIVLLGVDFLAWYAYGLTTLAAVLALPAVVWMTMGREGNLPHKALWNWLAGFQTFIASVLGGAWVIMEGMSAGNEYMLAGGAVLLLPAFVLAALFLLALG